ncbi:MAG: ABC transporter permease [Clostridiales bacterium]|jgi:ABC-2 type transport system permease protein|nr:ABC transporter permease [Clostridiales bacterium]
METVIKQHKPATLWRELSVIWALIMRDIMHTIKSPGTIIFSLVMPIVMMGMIGGNLTQNMAGGLGFDFGKFMLIGMMVNMLFMTTGNGVAELVDDHESNFCEEMLVAPCSRYALVIGKILGSWLPALVSMLGAVVVGAIMGISLSISQFLIIIALSPLICLVAGAMAVVPIGLIKNRRAANMVTMLLVTPQMFLCGAIIPIGNSSGILWLISRILPMTYSLDLTRAAVFAGTPEFDSVVLFNPAISLAATVAIAIVCLVVGTFFYARSEKNR